MATVTRQPNNTTRGRLQFFYNLASWVVVGATVPGGADEKLIGLAIDNLAYLKTFLTVGRSVRCGSKKAVGMPNHLGMGSALVASNPGELRVVWFPVEYGTVGQDMDAYRVRLQNHKTMPKPTGQLIGVVCTGGV